MIQQSSRFYFGFFLCFVVLIMILLWTIDALVFAWKRWRRNVERKQKAERTKKLSAQEEMPGDENLKDVVVLG